MKILEIFGFFIAAIGVGCSIPVLCCLIFFFIFYEKDYVKENKSTDDYLVPVEKEDENNV